MIDVRDILEILVYVIQIVKDSFLNPDVQNMTERQYI